MKKIYTILAALLLVSSIWAQSPEKISYQAVIRNTDNELLNNQTIGIQISILQGTTDGSAVYGETHTPTTSSSGLISIKIGDGNTLTGTFENIDWTDGPYFIKTETDPEGGNNYTITGTSQLLSVPYALHAKVADSLAGKVSESDPDFNASAASDISSADSVVRSSGW